MDAGLPGGLLIYGFGVVIMPFATEFGVSRQTLMLGSTLLALPTNLLSPFAGAYIDRRSISHAMAFGASLVALGFLLLSRVRAMWQVLAIFALVLPLGNLLLGQLSSTTLMTRWFSRLRGRVLGISAIGTSLGGLALPQMLAGLIERFGWSRAFSIVAMGVVIALVLAILWLIVDRPADVGQLPDGKVATANPAASSAAPVPVPLRTIVATARFWQLTAIIAFAISPYLALIANLVPFAGDLGIEPRQAALLLSTAAVIAIPGKLVFGALADHLGTRISLWLVVGFEAAALVAFLSYPTFAGLLIGCTMLGIAGGGLLPLWGLLISKGFGQASFGRAAGAMNPAMMPVTLLAAPFAEVVAHVRGHSGFYGKFTLGLSLLTMLFNAVAFWIPAYLIREHGLQPLDVALTYGPIMLVFGSAGIVAGGLWADRRRQRGAEDAEVHTGMLSALLLWPVAVAAFQMPSAALMLGLLAPLLFLSSLPFGIAAAALQLVTPNRLRARVSAVYLLVINLTGIGFGSTAAALLTDYVFHDERRVGDSVSLLAGIAAPLAALALARSRAAYRRMQEPVNRSPGTRSALAPNSPSRT